MARKKQIIVPIAILVAGIGSFMVFSSMKKPPEEKPEVDNTPIVTIENVSVSPITLHVKSYGIVKPKYETELVAQVSGQIVELSDIFVRGGFVAKDELLARIDPNDYQAALIEAQANMASARAALEKERAQGKVAEREWKLITDTSPTELSLRKPQLAQELARVKSAQAAVLRAKRNLERTEIKAPYDAMIDNRDIGLGSFVSVGRKIGNLLGTAVAEVRLPVADNQLQFLSKQGQNAKVELNGTYAGQTVKWQATIIRSEGVIDSKSRMNYLVASINDPYRLSESTTIEKEVTSPIRFGSYVKANILGLELSQATIIPRHLINNGKVALLNSESKLHYAEVTVARQDGADVIISQGLMGGDQLITSALDYPVNGMKLTLVGDEPETGNDDTEDTGNIESQMASAGE